MLQWSYKKLQLDLKFTWKISRGENSKKTIYIIEARDGEHTGFGEVTRITGDPQSEADFEALIDKALLKLNQGKKIERAPSHLNFGITSASIHLRALQMGTTVHSLLSCDAPAPIQTSYSLPLLEAKEIQAFYNHLNLSRFSVLKLKVNESTALKAIQSLCSIFPGQIRVDANESFHTAKSLLTLIDQIDENRIEFFEQPMPSTKVDEYKILKANSSVEIFADESMQQDANWDEISQQFHGINVKLMKAGSYENALRQLREAKQRKLKTMLGCMVETSLGIASALSISEKVNYFDLDGFLYFKEDPFCYVKEEKGCLTLTNTPPFSVPI